MVADCGSLTLAATRMLIAQPSLSQQISFLEHEIGCVLFEHVPRGMRLTTEGRAFLPYRRSAANRQLGAQLLRDLSLRRPSCDSRSESEQAKSACHPLLTPRVQAFGQRVHELSCSGAATISMPEVDQRLT